MTTIAKPVAKDRFVSRDPDAFPVPRGREEEWRFTPVRRIREFFEPFEPDSKVDESARAPESVTVTETDPRQMSGFGQALTPADRVSALAMAHARHGLSIIVPAGTELAEPILVERIGRGGRSYVHHVVQLGAYAKATLVLDHQGSFEEACNVEYVLGDGASLTVVSIQDADGDSIQLCAQAALIGRDASYRHFSVSLGGAVVRVAPTVRFAGPGGRAELLGVALAGPGQHLESRLHIEHSAPDCTSNVFYKNALLGETSRTVWIGDVRIRPTATGTDTYELNRNLLLTDGARADSVPNLEIETGEIVGAGHASATGRFDDLQLFYLMARGISEREARRLMLRGFFADIVERMGLPEIEQRLMAAIEDRLGAA